MGFGPLYPQPQENSAPQKHVQSKYITVKYEEILPVDDTVDSTSDERTANNVMRHEYRVLNDEEKALMKEIKDAGNEFLWLLHRAGGGDRDGTKIDDFMASRELSIAKTKIEEAVMWAVKHVTK